MGIVVEQPNGALFADEDITGGITVFGSVNYQIAVVVTLESSDKSVAIGHEYHNGTVDPTAIHLHFSGVVFLRQRIVTVKGPHRHDGHVVTDHGVVEVLAVVNLTDEHAAAVTAVDVGGFDGAAIRGVDGGLLVAQVFQILLNQFTVLHN